MPTQPYVNAAGQRLPGVTWVIGTNLGWNKDALKVWANREGLAGRAITRDFGGTTAQRAADIGTAAHAMIEAHIHGLDPEVAAASELDALSADDRVKAERGFGMFLRWFRGSRVVVLGTELWGIDEEYQTGFCIDAIGREHDLSDGIVLLDWKSSKGTYADHFIQIAAYAGFYERMWTRLTGETIRLEAAHVLRVSKESGAFKHACWDRDMLDDGWRAFTWLRALHTLKPKLEGYVR